MMNTKKIIVLSGLMMAFLSLSSFKSVAETSTAYTNIEAQEGFVVYAAFDGKKDNGYNFVINRGGKTQTITFDNVDSKVLSAFDLNTDGLVGTNFKVTFKKADADTDKEVSTITKLEKL